MTQVIEVYILHHVRELADYEDEVKLIGVYSSEELARAAISQIQDQPGFCDFKEGFSIDPYKVNKTHWLEGFFYDPD